MKTAPEQVSGNGQVNAKEPVTARRVGELTLEPPEARRRVRVPELLVGAALTVGFALAAVLWQANSTQREAALALATKVDRGDTITAKDLRVVYLGTDDHVVRLAPSESVKVIGQVAIGDMAAGTLITRANITDVAALGPGEGVVGLALDPGQFPSGRLTPGDLVNVVASGDTGGKLLAAAAVVYSVEELGGQGRKFVSLRASEADANGVAAAVEHAPVRLVLVGR